MEIKEAYVETEHDGTLWVRCPYCHHKLFPVEENTKIHNLTYKCKGSNCKEMMRIHID